MEKCTNKRFLPVLHSEVHDTDETQCHSVSHKTHAIYCFMWYQKEICLMPPQKKHLGNDKVSMSTHAQTHEED